MGGGRLGMDMDIGMYRRLQTRDTWPSQYAWQALTQEARDTAFVLAHLITDCHWAQDVHTIAETIAELRQYPKTDLARTMTHLQALADAGFAVEMHGSWALHHQAPRFLARERVSIRFESNNQLPEPGLLPLNSRFPRTSSLDELIPWLYSDLVHTVTEEDDLSVLGAAAGDAVILRLVGDPNEHDYEDISDAMPRSAWDKPLRLQRWTEDHFGYRLVAHIRLGPAAAQGQGPNL